MLFPTISALLLSAVYMILRVQGSSGSFPRPLTSEEEQDLIQRMLDGEKQARDLLIEHNLRLVAHIVKKYYAEPAEQDDLISIGTIGLIKAVSTYRPDKKVKLATYAARCIENEILMHFRANRKTASEVSLSETLDSDGEGNSLALMDVISCEDENLHEIELSDRYQQMYEHMNTCLDDREKQVIALRYGLGGGEPLTQREIAGKYGISRSYVSRIEKKALHKLEEAFGGKQPW
ncbi:MAG: RNA polymerase sporulation sigma factor SigK [Butyricicoccus pullicaecorum]|nr:RNA polymerase sporulation sigma factor SigK [Butyricicoccus pullicaecorum]